MMGRDHNQHHRNTNIIKECYEKLYANKLGNLEKMDKFLETYKLPKQKQEEIEHLNIPIARKEIKIIIKISPKQSPAFPMGNSTRHLKKS